MASFDRREHSGNAIPTTLASDITSGATALALAASTGWPTGSVGPFFLTINAGGVTEEKVIATTRSGVNLASLVRGQDNTSASAHSAGEPIVHGWTALEADESNQVANMVVGQIVSKGDSLWATAAKTLVRIPAGSEGAVVKYSSTQPAGVSTGYVDENSIAPSTWGPGLSGALGVPAAVNVDNATTTISAGKVIIKPSGVTTLELLDGTIIKTDVADGVLPKVFQQVVAGGPTSGTTELTLATLAIAAQPYAYTLECSAFWTGINGTAGDSYDFRIKVDGTTKAQSRIRHDQSGNNDFQTFNCPTSTLVTIAASTASTVVVTLQRNTGSGTTTSAVSGLVTARLFF